MRGLLLLVFSLPAMAAMECNSPEKKVVGEWFSQNSNEKFVILDNGRFIHSHCGEGDVRHISGNRYEFTYYSAKCGKVLRTCQAVLIPLADGSVSTLNPSKSKDCDFGHLFAHENAEPSKDEESVSPQ